MQWRRCGPLLDLYLAPYLASFLKLWRRCWPLTDPTLARSLYLGALPVTLKAQPTTISNALCNAPSNSLPQVKALFIALPITLSDAISYT